MNEFVEQFLIEGRELVSQGNDDLLALEEHPQDRERLDSAFRVFHTLKGAAGIVGFPAMIRALHAAEDGLSAIRAGSARVTPALVDLCLACLDRVGAWIDRTQASGTVPDDADFEAAELVRRFGELGNWTRANDLPPANSREKAGTAGNNLTAVGRQLLEAQKALVAEHPSGAAHLESAARVAANVMRHHRIVRDDLDSLLQSSVTARDPAALASAIDTILNELVAASGEALRSPVPMADPTLRIDAGRIDTLVRLTGELMIAKNAVGYTAGQAQSGGDPSRLAAALRINHLQLDRLTTELQQTVLSLRVLPLSHALQRFPRHIREMTASLEKPARLVIEGGSTEADKTIVEAIGEPLLHLLRNALDHGVEPAAERVASGKPATATLNVRAARLGDRIVVEVEDDGAGIDLARVREVARSRGVVADDALAAMSDEEVQNLIFAPGFSTATAVTAVSGRGVGMDVVRATVERLGGRVSVSSRSGKGTIVKLALPFSVMMTQVLTVEAGGQVFGVPLEAVFETIRIPRADVAPVGAAHAVTVRNRTIPIVHLGHALGGMRADFPPEATILIVSAGGELGGLEVDRLGERLDVMLKPPEGLLAGLRGIDGTTLLGDGRVLIVLDLQEIFGHSAVVL
jgi:two-component system, chemotaxis family, sensor kinase CheA